jgi:alpha-N-arabinofuranosidase
VSFWGLNGSASLKGKQLVLTVVNPHHNQERETEIAVRGAAIKSGETRTLTSTDLHARNTFANPRALEPKDAPLSASGSTITFKFAPASVTRLLLDLT